jgi:serine/threonine-protein kinase
MDASSATSTFELVERHRFTQAGAIAGTPDYFSPEQTLGDSFLDPRSDVFSLGTILFQVLTGSLPFHGENPAELIEAIRDHDPVLPRRLNISLPRALQNTCLKALEKNPRDRYDSAREMANDIARYLAGEEVLALPTSYLCHCASITGLSALDHSTWPSQSKAC